MEEHTTHVHCLVPRLCARPQPNPHLHVRGCGQSEISWIEHQHTSFVWQRTNQNPTLPSATTRPLTHVLVSSSCLSTHTRFDTRPAPSTCFHGCILVCAASHHHHTHTHTHLTSIRVNHSSACSPCALPTGTPRTPPSFGKVRVSWRGVMAQ
jgi:hypothetical protein